MQADILRFAADGEYLSDERCHILETANDSGDEAVSIARARVEPGVTTALHHLEGVCERYLIVSGEGHVEIGGRDPVRVGAGDVVRIPPGISQRIANRGDRDLVFYCICSPRFTPGCYVRLE